MNTKQERAAFEAWLGFSPVRMSDGGYADPDVCEDWRVWQARAALQSQDAEDAERYRWLRAGGNDDIGVVRGFDGIDCGSTSVAYTYEEGLSGDHLDEAIDHARRVEGGNHE